MSRCINSTYRGPSGEFTAHYRVNGSGAWITSAGRYIGGRATYEEATDAAIALANGKAKS